MSVPQMFLLLLRQTLQPVVALACGPLTVLPCAVEDAEQGETHGGDLPAKVDGVAGVVAGRVGGDVGPAVGGGLLGS